MFIQTEQTPNPATLKFLPGQTVLAEDTLELRDPNEGGARLALGRARVRLRGRQRRLLGSDLHQRHQDRRPGLVLDEAGGARRHHGALPLGRSGREAGVSLSGEAAADDDPTVRQIRELIDTPRAPGRGRRTAATSSSTASIAASSTCTCKGACAGCPSSVITLKNGIENLLKYYVPRRGRGPRRRLTGVGPLLAIDAGVPGASAAVLDRDGRVLACCGGSERADMLVPLIGAALAEAGVRPADLGALAVAVGPGSFTGVRVAVAAAKGLSLALRLDVHPVGTLSALARAARDAVRGRAVRRRRPGRARRGLRPGFRRARQASGAIRRRWSRRRSRHASSSARPPPRSPPRYLDQSRP